MNACEAMSALEDRILLYTIAGTVNRIGTGLGIRRGDAVDECNASIMLKELRSGGVAWPAVKRPSPYSLATSSTFT